MVKLKEKIIYKRVDKTYLLCYNIYSKGVDYMKNSNYKRNDMGKWVLDYFTKKEFKRIAKRKFRRTGKVKEWEI